MFGGMREAQAASEDTTNICLIIYTPLANASNKLA